MRLARQPLTAVAIVLVIALGIPLASDTPSAAATTLSFSPVKPIVGEYTWVRGRLSTGVVRPVRLEYYKSGDGWTVYPLRNQGDGALGRTFSGGYFRFRPRGAAPYRLLRVVAPRVQVNGRWYAAQVTSSRRLYAVRQTAALRLVPAPIGQAKNTTTTDLVPAHAVFSPIRAGRKAILQRFSGGSWRSVGTAAQNARGFATFNVPRASAETYNHRVVAASYNGAPYIKSAYSKVVIKTRRFRDEFSGSALDTAKWSHRQLGLRNPAGKRVCSEASRSAVQVANGTARLQVRRIVDDPLKTHALGDPYDENANCPYGQYYNGHIGTQNGKFDTQYGIMAARVKFPAGKGKHGAFWSQPAAGAGSEIDIVEYFGTRNNVQHKIYYGDNADGRIFDLGYLLGADKTYYNSFHIYSVEWTPSVYIFRVDGHETFRTARGRTTASQYLILSLLSSDYELPYLDRSSLPDTMFVDWVRVWR